jgi:hypothetical protein
VYVVSIESLPPGCGTISPVAGSMTHAVALFELRSCCNNVVGGCG